MKAMGMPSSYCKAGLHGVIVVVIAIVSLGTVAVSSGAVAAPTPRADGGATPARRDSSPVARDGVAGRGGVPAAVPPVDKPASPQLIAPIRSQPFTTVGAESRFKLRSLPDGGYSYRDTRFDARIAPDGRVTFRPRRILGPQPSTVPPGERSPFGTSPEDAMRMPPREVPRDLPRDSGKAGAQTSGKNPVAGPGITFDITDEYRRLRGKNPHAAAQADFLSSTYDLRVRMAAEHAAKQRGERLDELPGELARIWNDPDRSRREKLRILELLRGEIGEGPDAARAATIMDEFAQKNLTAEEAQHLRR